MYYFILFLFYFIIILFYFIFLYYVIDDDYSKDFFFGLVNGRQWRHVDLVTRCKWKAQKKNCLLFQRWHGERSVSMENQKKKRWISWFIRVWGAFCVVALFCFTRSASFLIVKRNLFYSGGWKRKLRWKYLTHQKGNVWPILVAKINPRIWWPPSRVRKFSTWNESHFTLTSTEDFVPKSPRWDLSIGHVMSCDSQSRARRVENEFSWIFLKIDFWIFVNFLKINL